MWNYLRETKAISPIKVKVGFFCVNEDVIYSLLSYCLCLLKCIKNRKITLPFHLNVQAYTSCITFLLISTLIYELKGIWNQKVKSIELLKTEWIEVFYGRKKRNWTMEKRNNAQTRSIFFSCSPSLPGSMPTLGLGKLHWEWGWHPAWLRNSPETPPFYLYPLLTLCLFLNFL